MKKTVLLLSLCIITIFAEEARYSLTTGVEFYNKKLHRRVSFFHADKYKELTTFLTNCTPENASGKGLVETVLHYNPDEYLNFKTELKDNRVSIEIKKNGTQIILDTTLILALNSTHHVSVGLIANGKITLPLGKNTLHAKSTVVDELRIGYSYKRELGVKSEHLLQAVKAGNLAEAEKLLKEGVNPNFKIQYSTLIKNARKTAMLELLLKYGAKPEFDNSILYNLVRFPGYNFKKFKLLVDHYDNLNFKFKKDGETPLTWLIKSDKLDGVQYLLEKGVDVNFPNKYNQTPLKVASFRAPYAKHRKEIRALLKSKNSSTVVQAEVNPSGKESIELVTTTLSQETPLIQDLRGYPVRCTIPTGSVVVTKGKPLSRKEIVWSELDTLTLSKEMLITFPKENYAYQLPKGTVISNFNQRVLKIHLKNEMSVNERIHLAAGTNITLAPNGCFRSLVLGGPSIINGVPVDKKSNNKTFKFNYTLNANSLVTARDTVVDGITIPAHSELQFNVYSSKRSDCKHVRLIKSPKEIRVDTFVIPANTKVTFYPMSQSKNERVLHPPIDRFITKNEIKIGGVFIAANAEVKLYTNGAIRNVSRLSPKAKPNGMFRKFPVYSYEELESDSMMCPMEVSFHKNGEIKTLVISEQTKVKGIKVFALRMPKRGKTTKFKLGFITLHPNGKLRQGILAQNLRIEEFKMKKYEAIEIDKNGELYPTNWIAPKEYCY